LIGQIDHVTFSLFHEIGQVDPELWLSLADVYGSGVTENENTKPHTTCFDTTRQNALVRYEEGFNSTFGLIEFYKKFNKKNWS